MRRLCGVFESLWHDVIVAASVTTCDGCTNKALAIVLVYSGGVFTVQRNISTMLESFSRVIILLLAVIMSFCIYCKMYNVLIHE